MRLIRYSVIFLLIIGNLYGSRVKDLTLIEGARPNQLLGYGLVVGLAGTGDGGDPGTSTAFGNALKQLGLNLDKSPTPSNVASVMITAEIAPFMKEGSKIDVTVSSTGSATTLQGGVLLQTPLVGADGTVYAVAQGPIAVGGFLGGSGGSTVQQNHPTVGKIIGGAIVEREIPSNILTHGRVNLLLLNPDYITAVRMADAINKYYPEVAQATNAGTVNVSVPFEYCGQEPNFIARLGLIETIPDVAAKVIVNERTGTIVATSNVRISTVAISHGSLTINIAQTNQVSQPGALAEVGETRDVTNTSTNVTEVQGGFTMVNDFPTIDRLTTALNALGVSTREMMSILQSIKSSGALQAELVII